MQNRFLSLNNVQIMKMEGRERDIALAHRKKDDGLIENQGFQSTVRKCKLSLWLEIV